MGQCLQNSAWKKKSAWVSTYNSILCPVRLSMKWESREKIMFSLTMISNYLPATAPFSGHAPPKWESDSRQKRTWVQGAGEGQRERPVVQRKTQGPHGRSGGQRAPGGLSSGEPGLQRWAERPKPVQRSIKKHFTGLWKEEEQKVVQEEKCNCRILFGSAANNKQ